jgi:site-specific recombinase XerD
MHMTLATALAQYRTALLVGDPHRGLAGKSERTVEAYTGAVRRVLATRADWADAEAMAPLLQAWRSQLQTLKFAKRVSDSKIRVEVAGLRSFFRWCISRGLVAVNPMDGVKSIKRDDRLPRPMAVPDVERLLSVLPITPASTLAEMRDRAMVECFIHGLRNVEVCRLQVGWVAYASGSKTLKLNVLGKGVRWREVYMNPASASFLAAYLLEQYAHGQWQGWMEQIQADSPVEKLLYVYGMWHDAHPELAERPVFVNGNRGVYRQEVNRIFRHYRDLAGLPASYGPHSLRHTCGTELLSKGEDIRTVQEFLGHKDIRTTQDYTRVLPDAKVRAATKLPGMGTAIL